MLDIGCGWGALLESLRRLAWCDGGVGLTFSQAQAAFAGGRRVPDVDFRVESWIDHQPDSPYDAITCIEVTEHLASDPLSADEKVDVYRAFFDRCAEWLRDDGRLGLQLICLDNVGHEGSRAGRGATSELIRVDIFPESMPASLSELVLGWETHFELERFLDHPITTDGRSGRGAWHIAPPTRVPACWSATEPRGPSRATSRPARRSSGCARTRSTASF